MSLALPHTFGAGDTVDAVKLQADLDTIVAKFNALIDETDMKYPSTVDTLPFTVTGALAAQVGKCVGVVPAACYATFVSARINGTGGGVDTIDLDIEWSTDAFATVNNLLAAGTATLTESATAAVFSGAQLTNQAIPANAQIRINLSNAAGAPADLTVFIRLKRYVVAYNSSVA